MNIYFIDPSALTNGSGTFASPFNVFPNDYSVADGANAYLLKAGTTLTRSYVDNVSGTGSAENQRLIIGAYGDGPKPKWINGPGGWCVSFANDNSHITLRDIDFYVSNSGASAKKIISNGSGTLVTTDIDFHIINCNLRIDATGGSGADNAIQLWGAGVKVLGNTFESVASDAIWIQGNGAEIAYNKILKIGTDGLLAGDGIQFSDTSENMHIYKNFVDHRDYGGKHCIMLGAGGTIGAVIEDNILLHTENYETLTYAIFCALNGVTVRRNFISGGRHGIWNETTAGENLVESNVVLNNYSVGTGIRFVNNCNHNILNNTVVSPQSSSDIGIRTPSSGTRNIKNNIIQGFNTGLYLQDVTTLTEDYNLYYDNTNNKTGTLGANSILVNPRLDANHVPQEFLATKLGTTGASSDLFGTSFVSAIGAIQSDRAIYKDLGLPLYQAINSY